MLAKSIIVLGVLVVKSLGNTLELDTIKKDEQIERNIQAQQRDVNPDILEDALLTCPQLVKKYGYPSETHQVETSDGYILGLHRIANPGSTPVLLMHGILDSSSTWVVMGPSIGFGYMLADLGYDVWMGNVRGNRYSREHKFLDPDTSSKFWDFSIHEIGLYDIPALIDYVLNETSFKKLHYVAHSQGSTTFLIMMTQKPQYNEKIISMHALAPVAYLQHCKSPFVRIMTFFLNTLSSLIQMLGVDEFAPNTDFLKIVGQFMCKDGSLTQAICANAIFLISGFNPDQLNTTMLPVIVAHAPAGASTKQFVHFGQLKRSGRFQQYDYGFVHNIIRYKSLSPPLYDLSKVTAKVALHYSHNDWLSEPQDVDRLDRQLPNSLGKFRIPYSRFNHLDFVWGIDVRPFLYEKIVEIMQLVEYGEL